MTAYAANGVVRVGPDAIARPALLPPKAPAVFVECSLHDRQPAARVNHHHPGDPGYTAAPEDYLAGSSLGQVLMLLEREPSETQRLLAASDHCLSAACQGRCPGVDAAGVQRFMAGQEAAGRLVYGNPYRGYARAYWPA